MKTTTEILHLRVDNNGTEPSVTPVYQCSAFTADSPYFYSRKNNPNVAEVEQVIAKLENAKHALAVTCGMSAIYMVMDLLRAGDRLVVNEHIYGCSYKLFQRLSKMRGFDLDYMDLSKEENIAKIPEGTKMVLFETPTNPFLHSIDIRKVSDHVKGLNPEALVVVDNTWATPLFQHPLEHGADISLHSGTKYFGGHSDVMSGVLLTDDDELHKFLTETRFYGGMLLGPQSAWLVRRSMQTFELRLRHQQQVTIDMSEFLKGLPQVMKLYYPEVDGKQLVGYGGIVFFELRDDLVPHYKEFTRNLKLFGTGTGMAAVTSMVAQPFTGSHASMTSEEKDSVGLGENLVRLCFGLEDIDDLKEDLLSAFKAIDNQ
ncbi:MAG: PLP-dependent transferase [bacterium]|nr:PLP-dependent transferase [bacterium]